MSHESSSLKGTASLLLSSTANFCPPHLMTVFSFDWEDSTDTNFAVALWRKNRGSSKDLVPNGQQAYRMVRHHPGERIQQRTGKSVGKQAGSRVPRQKKIKKIMIIQNKTNKAGKLDPRWLRVRLHPQR